MQFVSQSIFSIRAGRQSRDSELKKINCRKEFDIVFERLAIDHFTQRNADWNGRVDLTNSVDDFTDRLGVRWPERAARRFFHINNIGSPGCGVAGFVGITDADEQLGDRSSRRFDVGFRRRLMGRVNSVDEFSSLGFTAIFNG